eukprot:1158677-Pelagomonas_calceolata.AAC.9
MFAQFSPSAATLSDVCSVLTHSAAEKLSPEDGDWAGGGSGESSLESATETAVASIERTDGFLAPTRLTHMATESHAGVRWPPILHEGMDFVLCDPFPSLLSILYHSSGCVPSPRQDRLGKGVAPCSSMRAVGRRCVWAKEGYSTWHGGMPH